MSIQDIIEVKNLSTDWKNGLAFCGLIYVNRSDLIDFDALDQNESEKNLTLAFEIASDEFGNTLVIRREKRGKMEERKKYF